MKFCLIDFETLSSNDLKKSGAWRYAEDITTEIVCLGWTDGSDKVVHPVDELLHPVQGCPRLLAAVRDPDCMFIAHNVAFEKAMWRRQMVDVLGWPDIPNERWHDIMAVCAMKGLPMKLERAALVLRLSSQKDTEGSRITLSLSRANKKGFYDRTPEKLQRVYAYNMADLDAELALHRRVRGLGAAERAVWLMDQDINERGVCLDMGFVRAAQKICDDSAVPLLKEFEGITGGVRPSQRDRVMDWLQAAGCDIPDLKKETIQKFLGDENEQDDSNAGEDDDYAPEEAQIELPFDFRRALQIRQILGSASIKKLASMRACVGEDSRARGLLQYHGAGPGRWSGRLLQPQNFPRGTIKVGGKSPDPNEIVAAILTEDYEYVDMLFGEPISVVAGGLRHAIIASRGNRLLVGDFSTIEARIVLALAGQYDKVQLLALGKDIYIAMAESIYKHPVSKELHPEKRQTGKNAVLGLGFQMGWKKFKLRYAPEETKDFAQEVVRTYREDFAPCVPKLWRAYEEAAIRTVWDKRPHETHGVVYSLEDGWLTARLPSGRKLWYYNPQPSRRAMPWDEMDIRPGFTYQAQKMGIWKTIDAYGGLLTENVVQATARDLLVAAMFRLQAENYSMVLTVHDEVVCDVEEARADPKVLDSIMCNIPQWAKNYSIPVAAECWAGERYKK